jgi:phage/plasmid-associated DNA primase
MTGNFWNPQWVPITPSHTEVLFSDGIYNLMTDEFKEFDKIIFGPFLTTKWITEDGDEPVCHEFQELVEAQFPDLAERNHLQEVMSTVLQPHVPLRGQIVLFGVPYSRKTTLATAIACAGAGRSGMSQVQEATLVRDKFATHALLHKMVNVSDDSPRTNRWVGFVKQYTSGNMTVEPKFHQPVSVTPTAKLISTCNEVQSLLDSSGAATDRLYLFELKHSFEKIHGSSDSVRMTAEYWSEPSRRAGVCAWLVNGLKRLRARGRFAPPDSWTAALDKAKAEADEIACQLLDSFEPGGSDDFVAMSDIMDAVKLPKNSGDTRLVHKYIERLFPKACKGRNRTLPGEPRGYSGLRPAR